MHAFTKLAKDDITHLLRLMSTWSEWEEIYSDIRKHLSGLKEHLEQCDAMAKMENAPNATNFGSIAWDWYVRHPIILFCTHHLSSCCIPLTRWLKSFTSIWAVSTWV